MGNLGGALGYIVCSLSFGMLYFLCYNLFCKRRRLWIGTLPSVFIGAFLVAALIDCFPAVPAELQIVFANILFTVWSFIYIVIFYKEKILRTISLLLFTRAFIMLADMMVMMIFTIRKFYEMNIAGGVYAYIDINIFNSEAVALIMIFCHAVISAAVCFAAFKLFKALENINEKSLVTLGLAAFVFAAACYIAADLLSGFISFYRARDCLIVFGVILAVGAAFLIIFTLFCKRKMKNEKYDFSFERESVFQSRNFREARKIRHDLKNNIRTISEMIRNGDNENALIMLGELEDKLFPENALSGNPAVDAVLNLKKAICEEKNIPITIYAEALPETNIEPLDLSSAVSNLLDNAIEACENSEEPEILVRVFKYKMYLALTVENTSESAPDAAGNVLRSTKSEHRGCGTGIVREICEKWGGSFKWEYADGKFRVIALLKL